MTLSSRTHLTLHQGARSLGEKPHPGVPPVNRTLVEEDRYFEMKSDAEREEEWARDAELEDMRESDTEIVL